MTIRPSRLLITMGAMFVATLAVATLPIRAAAPQQRPAAPTQAAVDASQLFAKLYPVFTHPRCINCHGVVQSIPGNIRTVTGETHPGEEQGTARIAAECSGCHDESPEVEKAWEFTAPQSMEWVGKDLDQLCAMQAAQVENFNKAAGGREATRKNSYLNHLTTDPLITQAFHGRAGGAFAASKPAAPPPLGRDEFLAAATSWVNAGAPCRTAGSVSQVERFQANYSFMRDRTTTSVQEAARREVQIVRLADGTAVADVTMTGHRTQRTVTPLTGRFGACEATALIDVTWAGTPQRGVRAELTVDAQAQKYAVSFLVPPDKTKQRTVTTLTNTCGDPNITVPVADDDEIEWEPWRFVIGCPANFGQDGGNHITCDPGQHQKERKLSGTLLRTVQGQTDAAERQTWLNESPVGIARSDTGDPLAITIQTIWNLDLGR